MSEPYQPVPISAAADIARQYAKQIIVILACDTAHNMTHYTSFGVSPEEKIHAANLADHMTEVFNGGKSHIFEDFRLMDAAQAKAQIDALTAAQFVPGMWECPKCSFTLTKNILAAAGVFVDQKPHIEPCPNDGRDMVPLTWKKLADDLSEVTEQKLMDNLELRKLCKAAYHALSSIIAHRDGIPTPRLQDLADKLNAAAGGVEA